MDPAAPTPAPRFSPDDTLLLEAFLASRRDLLALAKRRGRAFHELLAWFDQPHIQHALKVLSDNEEHDHRAAARAHLRAVADEADTPAERRRAATSLLASLRTRATGRTTETESRATEIRPGISVSPDPKPSERTTTPPRDNAPTPATPSPATNAPTSPAAPSSPHSATLPLSQPATSSPSAAYLAAIQALGLPDIDDEEEDRLLDEEDDRELDEELDEEAEQYAHLSTEELVALAREAAHNYFADRASTPPITLPLPLQRPAP